LKVPQAEDVKRLRLRMGLTQKALAQRAGVSQSLIARIEAGAVDPRLSTLTKILNAMITVREAGTARDIMHTPVISIEATETVRKAVDLMERYGISQLPVLKDGRVVGSVQEATVVGLILRSKDPAKIFDEQIQNLMEGSFPIMDPSTSIDDVLTLFSQDKPAVLVADKGKLVGIVTKIDVVTALKPAK